MKRWWLVRRVEEGEIMNDFAQPLAVPRPKTRLFDKTMAWVDGMSLYLLALIIGAVIGIAQGALQSNAHWTKRIVERSTVDPSGIAMPVYEDVEGNVYYVHREVRP